MKRKTAVWMMILCLTAIGAQAEEEPAPALYPIRENGLWGYMNRAGETVIEPQWKTALPFSGDAAFVSMSEIPNPFQQSLGSGHHDGLIDRHGNYIVEPAPERIVLEYDTAWRIVDTEADAEGFRDKASGFYQPPLGNFEQVILSGDGSGPVAVMDSDGKIGYVSRETGEIVIPFQYTAMGDNTAFYHGYARPADETVLLNEYGEAYGWDEKEHLIDSRGNEVTLPDSMVPVSYVKDGYVIYSIPLETEEAEEERFLDMPGYEDYMPGQRGIGLARLDGTVIIEADPSIALMSLPDENGLVCFLKDTHETMLLAGAELPLLLAGHMDMEGHMIVPPTYNTVDWELAAYAFENGYAVIEDFSAKPENDMRWVIIDTAGHEIFSRQVYTNDRSFFLDGPVQENGLIWYSIAERNTGERCCGLLRIADGQAEYLTDAIYESHAGSVLPVKQQEDFAEGLHPVRQNGLWGYINEQAEMVIPPAWDSASSFRDGLALAEKNGKLMYIDRSGAVVWEEK